MRSKRNSKNLTLAPLRSVLFVCMYLVPLCDPLLRLRSSATKWYLYKDPSIRQNVLEAGTDEAECNTIINKFEAAAKQAGAAFTTPFFSCHTYPNPVHTLNDCRAHWLNENIPRTPTTTIATTTTEVAGCGGCDRFDAINAKRPATQLLTSGELRLESNRVKVPYFCPTQNAVAASQCTGEWTDGRFDAAAPTNMGFDCWTLAQVCACVWVRAYVTRACECVRAC